MFSACLQFLNWFLYLQIHLCIYFLPIYSLICNLSILLGLTNLIPHKAQHLIPKHIPCLQATRVCHQSPHLPDHHTNQSLHLKSNNILCRPATRAHCPSICQSVQVSLIWLSWMTNQIMLLTDSRVKENPKNSQPNTYGFLFQNSITWSCIMLGAFVVVGQTTL